MEDIQPPHGARGTPQHQGADAAKRSESLLYQTKKNEDAFNRVHQSTWAGTSTCLRSLPPVSILVKGCSQDVFACLLPHVPIMPNMKSLFNDVGL